MDTKKLAEFMVTVIVTAIAIGVVGSVFVLLVALWKVIL